MAISRRMKKPLSLEQVLIVRCPTCGAAPGEKRELNSGQPRTDPHRDRPIGSRRPTFAMAKGNRGYVQENHDRWVEPFWSDV